MFESPESKQWRAQQADQSMRSAVEQDNEDQQSGIGIAVLFIFALGLLFGFVTGKCL